MQRLGEDANVLSDLGVKVQSETVQQEVVVSTCDAKATMVFFAMDTCSVLTTKVKHESRSA